MILDRVCEHLEASEKNYIRFKVDRNSIYCDLYGDRLSTFGFVAYKNVNYLDENGIYLGKHSEVFYPWSQIQELEFGSRIF